MASFLDKSLTNRNDVFNICHFDTVFTSNTGELPTFCKPLIDQNMDFKALLQAEINRKRQKIESKDVLVR